MKPDILPDDKCCCYESRSVHRDNTGECCYCPCTGFLMFNKCGNTKDDCCFLVGSDICTRCGWLEDGTHGA